MLNGDVSNPYEDGLRPEPAPPVRDDPGGMRIPRPKAVDTAFQASIAGAVIGAVATVLTLVLNREMMVVLVRDTLRGAGLPDGEQEVAAALGTFRLAMAFGVAVFLGLSLLFALKMRAGRNWARMVITVLAFIGVVRFLNAMAASGAELGLIWSLAEVAFAVTAVVFMFRPESTAYFAEHRKRRLAGRGGGNRT
jgi:hypothetical protein